MSSLNHARLPKPSAQALQVASRVIQHARHISISREGLMCCLDCHFYPELPVTGLCGHTRCSSCIEENGDCPCKAPRPKKLHLNVFVQDLLNKMLPHGNIWHLTLPTHNVHAISMWWDPEYASDHKFGRKFKLRPNRRPERRHRHTLECYSPDCDTPETNIMELRQPIPSQLRFNYATELLSCGRFVEAAPHLALVAASKDYVAPEARKVLAQVVGLLLLKRDPRVVTRELFHSVRRISGTTWLNHKDLECIICCNAITMPVTTPCGHTFCRGCLKRTIDNNGRCPLCCRQLNNFFLSQTADTLFIKAALKEFTPRDSDEFIPIFSCTVAFPSVPCHLLIFDPRSWSVIRRVLDSGSRKFGMVVSEKGEFHSVHGTLLEIKDCLQFEDGRSILSTVGVSRFEVIEKNIIDGCHMARIQEVTDVSPNTDLMVFLLNRIALHIYEKSKLWLASLNASVRSHIESAFGQMPEFDSDDAWWELPSGPEWLWWVIAVLPLRPDVKALMLSKTLLVKRMFLVSRSLDFMEDNALTPVPAQTYTIHTELIYTQN